MTWDVNDREFKSVLSLPAPRRYEYLIKRSASHGELWGLHGDGGWVMAEDADGRTHFPLWPHFRFADACSTGPWKDGTPEAIDIDEWVEAWTRQLRDKGFRIAAFQTPTDQGISVPPEQFSKDVQDELSLFEL